MVSFFSKKHYIQDLLENFVDIHNHILPGIDDGAKNIKESLALLNKLEALGIKQFIPTPHVMQDYYPNTDESIGNAFELLISHVNKKKSSAVTINPAAEYMLDANFEKLLKQDHLFTLKRNYVLVELSYLQPPIKLEDLIFKIKLKGYIPVLAHPERYFFYHNKLSYYHRLKALGCLFQLNLLALGPYYGKQVQKATQFILSENLYDFAGTDAHHLKHAEALENLSMSKKTSTQLKTIIHATNQTFSVI